MTIRHDASDAEEHRRLLLIKFGRFQWPEDESSSRAQRNTRRKANFQAGRGGSVYLQTVQPDDGANRPISTMPPPMLKMMRILLLIMGASSARDGVPDSRREYLERPAWRCQLQTET